jgi:hypothetical protein
MPSDLDRAVRWSKRLEGLLERRYGARGRGLHEKTGSVERDLSPETVRALRLVATVRNRIVHEEGYDRIDDRRRFRRACKAAERALAGKQRSRKIVAGVGLVLVLAVAVAALLSGRAPLAIF